MLPSSSTQIVEANSSNCLCYNQYTIKGRSCAEPTENYNPTQLSATL